MTSFVKYQKITDDFTTYQLREPDYADDDPRVTEMATIDGVTYVAVPAGVTLPDDQPKEITVEPVVMTEKLRATIAVASPHERLINRRIADEIRAEYSIDDEIALIWKAIADPSDPGVFAYRDLVDTSVVKGRAKKVELGLRKAAAQR